VTYADESCGQSANVIGIPVSWSSTGASFWRGEAWGPSADRRECIWAAFLYHRVVFTTDAIQASHVASTVRQPHSWIYMSSYGSEHDSRCRQAPQACERSEPIRDRQRAGQESVSKSLEPLRRSGFLTPYIHISQTKFGALDTSTCPIYLRFWRAEGA